MLFCSEARAIELGIPREKWIYPAASVQSNHMVPVVARADLSACPGARIAGRAALSTAGLSLDDVDLIELYSCFPLTVETYAEALGIALDRDLTVTGGMPFAGGPYNNYVLQATCRAAELIRAGRGRNALISSVSGVLTKHGFGVLTKARPENGFEDTDVSATSRARCTCATTSPPIPAMHELPATRSCTGGIKRRVALPSSTPRMAAALWQRPASRH